MPTLFHHEIRHSFPSGEGKPSNAFNILASLGSLLSFFTRAHTHTHTKTTIVSEKSQAPSSVYNVLGVT